MATQFGPWEAESDENLGVGGFGSTIKVRHVVSNRRACLKIPKLSPDPSERDAALSALATEIAALKQMQHNRICAYIDHGTKPVPYVVMEYVPGETLMDEIDNEGALPEEEWLFLARDVLSALSYTSGLNITHRDLHPNNIMRSARKSVIIDFGLAIGSRNANRDFQSAVGILEFMSPESFDGFGSLTPRSDLFQAGCGLFFGATGARPFGSRRDGSDAEVQRVLDRIISSQPDFSSLTPRQAQIIQPMLAKDPAARPNPSELLALVTSWIGSGGLPPMPNRAPAYAAAPPPAMMAPLSERVARPGGLGKLDPMQLRMQRIAQLKQRARMPNADIRTDVQAELTKMFREFIESRPSRPFKATVLSMGAEWSIYVYRENAQDVDLLLTAGTALTDRQVASLQKNGWSPVSSDGMEYSLGLFGNKAEPVKLALKLADTLAISLNLGVSAVESLKVAYLR